MGLWLDRGRECDNLHQAIEIQIIHYLCGTDSPVSVALNTPLDRPIDRALRGFFIQFCYPSVTRTSKCRSLVANKPICNSELQPILERSHRFCIGILGSSLFAGCNNDDPVTPDAQPEIVFAKESLDVPAEGGPFQIEYTIENPVANATLSAKCNDSWITDIDTKTAGVISFNVTKNETAEKREAIIEVSYADIQPAPSFTAKQAARPEEAFTITISDITTKTFRTTVRPGDQEMYYLLNIIPSRAAADFKTDDELYQYDIDFYTDMDATGSGWQSWAQEYLEQGTIADRLIENMEPNTEYLVYAYGVDPITIERLTPISKKTLTTLAPQTIDTKFDIQIVSTEGLNIDVLVKANDYDGHFVAKIYGSVDAADTDATVLEKISESWIDNVQIYGWMGYTAEMILSQYTFQQSREIQETLEPNSKYYIYAFAVDDEALRCSDIVFIPITTNDTSIQH